MENTARKSSRWPQRLLALALGLVLTPLLLEGALRVLAYAARDPRGGEAGASFAICQGDSYTYGLFLPSEEAYPERLQSYLGGSVVDGRVVNLGVPGKPTWVLLSELARDIRAYRPRVVLLLAGVNNTWRTRPPDDQLEQSSKRQEWRIVRTWRLIRQRFHKDQPQVSPSPVEGAQTSESQTEGSVSLDQGRTLVRRRDRQGVIRSFEVRHGEHDTDYARWIEEDMVRAIELARTEDVEPVVLSYPATGEPFDTATAALERAASATGAPFVDLRPAFADALAIVPSELLFFEDRHTKALGCDLMARVLAHRLKDLGLVQVGALPEILGGLQEHSAAVRVDPIRERGKVTEVRAQYKPGHQAYLLISRAKGSSVIDVSNTIALASADSTDSPTVVPLGADALLKRVLDNLAAVQAPFDSDGVVTLPVPHQWLPPSDGPRALAFACVLAVGPAPSFESAMSNVLEIPLW